MAEENTTSSMFLQLFAISTMIEPRYASLSMPYLCRIQREEVKKALVHLLVHRRHLDLAPLNLSYQFANLSSLQYHARTRVRRSLRVRILRTAPNDLIVSLLSLQIQSS